MNVQKLPSSSHNEESIPVTTVSAPVIELEILEKLGHGYREKHPLVRLADYITQLPGVKSTDQVTNLIHEPYLSVTPYLIDNYI